MSKFRIGDNVIVKETGNFGVIKGREIVPLEGKKNRIEYVVKVGNGYENWKCYTKNELEKVRKKEEKKVYPKLVIDAENGYKVTVVALIETIRDFYDFGYPYEDIEIPVIIKHCRLSIGYSIYNPEDEYDEEMGQRIALHRAKTNSFSTLYADTKAEFTKDTVSALLYSKGKYIADNVAKFIKA